MKLPATVSSLVQRSTARRTGVAIIVVVIVLVVVIAGAGAYYFFVLNIPAPAGNGGKTTTKVVTPTTTIPAGAVQHYSGTFIYSNALGPTGDRLEKNNTVSTYSTLLQASGTFDFFINPANYSGLGSGQGHMTAITSGYCSGETSFNYAFQIPNANDLLGGNVTIAFDLPTPGNGTYSLTCNNENGTVTTIPGSFTYLSVFPNLISFSSVPSTISFNQTGIYYQVKLSKSP